MEVKVTEKISDTELKVKVVAGRKGEGHPVECGILEEPGLVTA